MATVQKAGEEADNRGIQTVAGELVEVIEENDIQVSARERDLEELELVLDVLPPEVAAVLRARDDLDQLLEIILDLGRLPEAAS